METAKEFIAEASFSELTGANCVLPQVFLPQKAVFLSALKHFFDSKQKEIESLADFGNGIISQTTIERMQAKAWIEFFEAIK